MARLECYTDDESQSAITDSVTSRPTSSEDKDNLPLWTGISRPRPYEEDVFFATLVITLLNCI